MSQKAGEGVGDNLGVRDSKQGMESSTLECRVKSSQHNTFLLFSITDCFFALLFFCLCFFFFFSLKENSFSSKSLRIFLFKEPSVGKK